MVRGSLGHLDLTVVDVARSARFYAQALGHLGYRLLPEARAGAPCWGIMDAHEGVFSIALQPAGSASAQTHDRYTPGLHHVGFHVDAAAEVNAFYEFLQQIGARILDPPATYDYTRGYYAAFFADPDGLKLEVVYEPTLRG